MADNSVCLFSDSCTSIVVHCACLSWSTKLSYNVSLLTIFYTVCSCSYTIIHAILCDSRHWIPPSDWVVIRWVAMTLLNLTSSLRTLNGRHCPSRLRPNWCPTFHQTLKESKDFAVRSTLVHSTLAYILQLWSYDSVWNLDEFVVASLDVQNTTIHACRFVSHSCTKDAKLFALSKEFFCEIINCSFIDHFRTWKVILLLLRKKLTTR